MPTGPFGLPRITNIGPFVEADAEQEFNREISKPLEFKQGLDREVLSIHKIDAEEATVVRSTLDVKIDPEYEDDKILSKIREELGSITDNREVAYIRYWFHEDSGVSAIKSINVDEELQRHGIATSLKEKELDYMRDKGIDVVYTDVVSNGGYRLARNTGFKPIDQATHLRGTEAMLNFDHNLKRGIMFRSL